MRAFVLITAVLLVWTMLEWSGQIVVVDTECTRGESDSVDDVALRPRFETGPIELKSNVDVEAVASEDIVRMAESARCLNMTSPRPVRPEEEQRRSDRSTDFPLGVRPPLRVRRPLIGPPPMGGKICDVRLLSDGAGEGTLAVRIVAPKSAESFRYPEGAPVMVFVPGGFSAGGLTGGLRGVVEEGIVQITYNFPGGGAGGVASDGVYDYRGMNCIRATRDVIRFAMGELTDREGRRLHEIVEGRVCYDSVGVLGSSSGGMMFFSTVARFPEAVKNLAWYVGWENPTTGQTLLFDMGAKNARTGEPLPNPAFIRYGPKACEMDYSRLKWDPKVAVEFRDPKLMGGPGAIPPDVRKGALYLDNNGNNRCDAVPALTPGQPFDRNGNGRIDRDEDWAFAFVAHRQDSGLKVYYSQEVINAAYERDVFGEEGAPDFVATPQQCEDYWKIRNSLPAFPLLKRHNPELKVILGAGEVDHVQACPAFPAIQQAYDGLGEAGIWRRMNPDAAYVQQIAGKKAEGVFRDNDANVVIPVGEMKRFTHPMGGGVPKPLFQLAAVVELADRARLGNEQPNLDEVLWKRPQRAPADNVKPASDGAQRGIPHGAATGSRKAAEPVRPLMPNRNEGSPFGPGRRIGSQPPQDRPEHPRAPGAPSAGPYMHKICSAFSSDGLEWTRDPGVRAEHASVPCAIAEGDERMILYYVDADRGPGKPESVGCAISTDGVHFEKKPFSIAGLPAEKALDPSVLKDGSGTYRLYYFASSPGSQDENRHEIHLALSEDGVHFEEAGLVFAHPRLVDPDVFLFKDTWFMYVFGDGRTVIATSSDGRRFNYHSDLHLRGWGTVAPLVLKDGRLRLYAFEQHRPSGNVVRSFISTDGFRWATEEGIRLRAEPGEQITDPFVVRWKGGYKMFFKTQSPPERKPPILAPRDAGPQSDEVWGAASKDGLEFRILPGPFFRQASVPDVVELRKDCPAGKAGTLVLYFCDFPGFKRPGTEGISVATSSDGVKWSRRRPIALEAKRNKGGAVDPSIVQLPDGKIRMYFFGSEVVRGDPARAPGDHVIYSALSEDGVHFVVEEGERFQAPHITDPEVVKAGDEWLMFLSRGPETLLARSKDGFDFEQDATFHLRLGGVPGAVVLPNGKVRIFACSRQGIVSAVFDPKSEYAVNVEPGARVARGEFGLVADPAPVLRSDGTHYLIFKTRPRGMGPAAPEQPGERPEDRGMRFPQPREPGQNLERRLPETGRRGPWENDLMIAWSKDGLHFEARPEVFVTRAHVPTVTQDATGRIIALFQWFPLEPAGSFDRIAASFSSDGGKTWTKPKTINITGIPGEHVRPCDPALAVLADGNLRLYFTCDLLDGKGPVCLSAVSQDGLNYECEPGIRFSAEGGVLDPAVVRIGDKWHYYAPGRNGSKGNYHAVSSDGLEFRRADDIVLDSFRMLGSAVEVEGGCRFYDGPRSAFSPDGYRWTIDPGTRVAGPDPGITRLKDGCYLMVYGILRGERRPGGGMRSRSERKAQSARAGLAALSDVLLGWKLYE